MKVDISKIKKLANIIKRCNNWHTILLARYGFLGKGYHIINFRNGLKIKIKKPSTDYITVTEMLFDNPYDKFYKISKNSVVIDIGAHIGAFSVYAAYKGAKVYSYEPEKENFGLLKENIALNSLDEDIKAFNIAVWGSGGYGHLLVFNKFSLWNTMISEWGLKNRLQKSGKQVVKKITLSDIFKMNHIKNCDFLKMDCEGAEYEILFKTPKNILRRMKNLVVEYHQLKDHDYHDLIEFFEKNGFNINHILQYTTMGFIYATR